MSAYFDVGMGYARDVVDEKIPACKWVRLACERQLTDLDTDGFGYRFDIGRADRVCKFLELTRHIKGRLAGTKLKLEPWQVFEIQTIFGWVDKQGYRRFKQAYEEVPRKNGKSLKVAGVGLYLLAADGEEGAEVYTAATNRDQAKIVFLDAVNMVRKDSKMAERFALEVHGNAQPQALTAGAVSSMKPMSRDSGGNHDGYNVHGALIDEFHAHKTRDIYGVIDTATGARSQPLIYMITTAGYNRRGPCYAELRPYAKRVLEGRVEDPEFFSTIYTLDDAEIEDEERCLSDETLWRKANPNFDVSVSPADLERKARKARQMPQARVDFYTKHLNVWVNAGTAWMDMLAWQKCGVTDLDLHQIDGQGVITVDIASRNDLACVGVHKRVGDRCAGVVQSFTNQRAVENAANEHYADWLGQGLLEVAGRDTTDLDVIERHIVTQAEKFGIDTVVMDQFQAVHMAQNLERRGLNVVMFNHTWGNFSPACKELEAMVLTGRYMHENNSVSAWCMENVVMDVNENKGLIYPKKAENTAKIDDAMVRFMAVGFLMLGEEESDDDWFDYL